MVAVASIGVFVFIGAALGRIHFEENFNDDSWRDRWTTSTHNGATLGKFERTVYNGDPSNLGLKTMEDDKKYAISTKFTPFNIANKPLVLQLSRLSVKLEEGLSSACADGYIRLYGCDFKPSDTHENTPYIIMFGSFLCEHLELKANFLGGQTLHRMLKWKGDKYPHVYTVIIQSDMTYQVLMDGKQLSTDRIVRGERRNESNGSRNDVPIFSPICGIGLVFYQEQSGTIFDNILLSDDVHVAERKREEILQDMWVRLTRMRLAVNMRLEWFRSNWLVHISPKDLTRILDGNESIEFKNNNKTSLFLVDFDKFLVQFNWSGNNTAIRAAAEYNKYHSTYNESIQIWVSFEPQKQNILDDISSVLEIVKEANFIFVGTVPIIVLNYGFLELDKQIVPFVNHEIQKVTKKLKSFPVPTPKLALQISDTNCQSAQTMQYLEINFLKFLMLMPMQSEENFAAMNELNKIKALIPCWTAAMALKRTNMSVLHTFSSIEIDFEAGLSKYKNQSKEGLLEDSRLRMIHAHAADKLGGNVVDGKIPGSKANNLANWLYLQPAFRKSHFGAAISWKDKELLGSKYFASTVFQTFQHILIHVNGKDSKDDDCLSTVAQEIANYSLLAKKLGTQKQHSFPISEHNELMKTSILVTVDTTNVATIKHQSQVATAAALKANEIAPGSVNAIFFDWLACSRSEICSGDVNKNISQDICLSLERQIDIFKNIMRYAREARNKTGQNTMLSIGSVLDKQFWDDQYEWTSKDCNEDGWHMVESNDVALCKSTVRHRDIVKYGGAHASKSATLDFSVCNLLKRKGHEYQLYFYVNVIGCVGGGYSNMTLLVEYAKLMENLNGWAEGENVTLFTSAGAEVPSECSESMHVTEEADCNCGWWIKQISNGKYQDKKTVARQFYEQAKSDERKSKTVIETESFLWLWVSIPIITFGVLFTILAVFFVFHYRSKHILTKREVDEFIKGRLTTRAEPAVEGDEAAETQSYNCEKYELSPSNFTIDTNSGCLGSGEFGRVFSGSIRRDGKEIQTAVKMRNTSLVGKSHGYYLALKGMLTEIKILAYVGEHNHIVSLLGAYTKKVRKGEIAVFLELCQLGSLDKYLHTIKPIIIDDHVASINETSDSDGCSIDEEEHETAKVQLLDEESSDELFRWAGEIANGMEFLASKKLVHADLATRNVLLTTDKVAKICDFGLSRRLYDYTEYVKQNQGPMPWRWMAPESLCRSIFNEKTDVWAFGVTLWEMFTLGDQPYPGLTWTANFPALLDRGLRLPEPRFNLKKIYSVMLRCWDISPGLRPSFGQLKSELNLG